MTPYEWTMVSISGGGFAVTIGGVLSACVWAVSKIKQSTSEQIAIERTERAAAVAKAMDRFDAAQKTQDHNFGEVGLSLRRFIEEVEKEMHAIEMWGRDNYALKVDTKDIRTDIKEMRAEIKADLKSLSAQINNGH